MRHHRTRILFDVLLSAMLIFEMFYTFTGNLLHEVVGVLFFATLIIHILLSRKWFSGIRSKSKAKRKLTGKQRAKLWMSILLGVGCIILLASSVFISNLLGDLTGWQLDSNAYSWWVNVHTIFAYAICMFTICHVGLHWVGVFRAFRIPYSPQRRNAINMGVTSLAAIGMVSLGYAASKALVIPPSNASDQKESAQTNATSNMQGGNGSENSFKEERSTNNKSNDTDMRGEGFRGNPPERDRSQGFGGRTESDSNPFESRSDIGPSTGNSHGLNNDSMDSGSNSGSTESSSSICTLCGKRCPLSSPRCNRPYDAGLI